MIKVLYFDKVKKALSSTLVAGVFRRFMALGFGARGSIKALGCVVTGGQCGPRRSMGARENAKLRSRYDVYVKSADKDFEHCGVVPAGATKEKLGNKAANAGERKARRCDRVTVAHAEEFAESGVHCNAVRLCGAVLQRRCGDEEACGDTFSQSLDSPEREGEDRGCCSSRISGSGGDPRNG